MNTSETKQRTITLTGRPPVKIVEDDWPTLARASYHDYDGEFDFQANHHWRGSVRVRQHQDGRAIVYAVASYSHAYATRTGEYEQRAGELLSAEAATTEGIVAAIQRVHGTIDVVRDSRCGSGRAGA